MYTLELFGTIWDGPFNTLLEAERALEDYYDFCGCGCGQVLTLLAIGTI